ncbi:MAG: DUF2950 domain-containing protein [Steroidobacteraceae bacterium]
MRAMHIRHRLAALACAFLLVAGCGGGKSDRHARFDTPQAAVDAFVDALEKNDQAALAKLLGPDIDGLLSSGDPVQDQSDRQRFLAAYAAKHSLEAQGDGTQVLVIGENDWPFPIPVVEHKGKWHLDGNAGADELIYRRIGHNELGAIAVCRGFVGAQKDYASQGHDGDPAGIYALKLISDEGTQNGLYWPTADSEPASPAGPFVAKAAEEGYRRSDTGPTPYHGYYYRMLYAQGANAPGGARDYFKGGVLTEGFALVAWPADYGTSGVQTFIVSQDGTVYQKDLGEDTASAANAILSFDPDPSWKPVPAGDVAAAAGAPTGAVSSN